MANSATLVDTICARVGSVGPVFEYEIVIDTVDTDLDVRTPPTGQRLFVVGIWLGEGNAANLTFKTATKSQTFELAANQGLPGAVGENFFFATGAGEKLTVRSSAAITSTVGKNLVLRLVQGNQFIAD